MMKKLILVALMILPMLAQAQTFKYQKDISGFKHYKGNVTLTGTYSRTLDPEYLEYMGDGFALNQIKNHLLLFLAQKVMNELHGSALAILNKPKNI
jgi:hypothetical protein